MRVNEDDLIEVDHNSLKKQLILTNSTNAIR